MKLPGVCDYSSKRSGIDFTKEPSENGRTCQKMDGTFAMVNLQTTMRDMQKNWQSWLTEIQLSGIAPSCSMLSVILIVSVGSSSPIM